VGTNTYEILPAAGIDLRLWLGTAPNALIGGAVDADVSAFQANVITAAALATDAINEIRDAILNDSTPFNGASIAAILADTAEIGAAGAGLTDLGGMSTAMKGQVNTEVDTALATTTYAEPSAVPAATASLEEKIAWLFTLARNKVTQTSTTQTLRDDADGADIATSAVTDDGTTLTRGEWS
jgi:hypothetical protein